MDTCMWATPRGLASHTTTPTTAGAPVAQTSTPKVGTEMLVSYDDYPFPLDYAAEAAEQTGRIIPIAWAPVPMLGEN